MNKSLLIETIARLTQSPKGILAIDESLSTCNKRFEKLGIPTTIEKRREYRDLLITTPHIQDYISGYILFDETIRQSDSHGHPFTEVMKEKGLDIGIKVDEGTVEDDPRCPGEKVTVGLNGLPDRLKEYRAMGATFAKWRGVYRIDDKYPSQAALIANAEAFAQYAKMCQEADIVPIVEPEILTEGDHTIEKCYEVTASNLQVVFAALNAQEVFIPGLILKTHMVLPGDSSNLAYGNHAIAQMTIRCLKENVPENIGGIVFLSGGQKEEDAVMRLNEMHKLGPLPWPLTFSYGRAIQNPALKSWAENPQDFAGAQKKLFETAKANAIANTAAYESKPDYYEDENLLT